MLENIDTTRIYNPATLGLSLFIVDERKYDRLSFDVDACDISCIDRFAYKPLSI